MENLILIVTAIAGFLNSILIIGGFIGKVKKPVDKAMENKIKEIVEPIYEKLDNVTIDIKKLDKNQCMNYLVNFLEDLKNSIPKDDIQRKRASEVYDHYTYDLHGNSYIHDNWEKYMK